MKTLVIAAVVAASFAPAAFAGSFNNSCGPQASIGLTQDTNNFFDSSRNNDGLKLTFGLKWTLGEKHRQNCESYNTSVALAEREKLKTDTAKRMQEEADVIQQKIRICKDFTVDTAPESIAAFCGDLLQ